MKHRCIPGNLVMAEAVKFGQRWTYYSNHPMKAMLNPHYFLSVRGDFRVGDDIRIIKLYGGKVACFAEALIIDVENFSFFIIREPVNILEPDLSIRKGKDCFEIIDSTGDVIEKFNNEKQAKETLGLMLSEGTLPNGQ